MTHEEERPTGDCTFCGKVVMESEQAPYMAPAHEDCYDAAREEEEIAPTQEDIYHEERGTA